MSKEFVRNIRNTSINEPLNTNEQNDILSDKNNIYIRNKDGYFPLTKSILKINATDTIVSVVENIDGTSNNNVELKTNEEVLKQYISNFSSSEQVEITPQVINELISVKNGLEKSIIDDKLEIYNKYDTNNIYDNLTENNNKLENINRDLQTLQTEDKIRYLQFNSNYDDIFQTLEIDSNLYYILIYKNQYFTPLGKKDNTYYFYNITKGQSNFIDYQLIGITQSNANLYITSLTPSEVISI